MEDKRLFSFDIIKKIPLNVPSLLGLIYFFGFLIVRAYLNKFNFHSVSLLNTDYLAVGTLFSIIFGSLFLSIFYSIKNEEKTSLKDMEFILPAILRILIIIYVTTLFTTIYSSDKYFHRVLGNAGLSFVLFSFFLNKSKYYRDFPWKLKIWLLIIFLAVINVLIFIFFPSSRALSLLLTYAGLGIILVISSTFKNKFMKVQAVGIVFIAITFATTFGLNVYGNIPRQYGGAKPYSLREIVLTQDFEPTAKALLTKESSLKNVTVYYETGNEMLLYKDSSLFVLPKKYIEMILTKQ
jgi:hypothetical protein